jgi:hypothetical protein
VLLSTDLVEQVPVLIDSNNGHHGLAKSLYDKVLSSEFGLFQDVAGLGAK